ncbi:MAG: SpaA isopeptide-forming pilin-related protein [Bacteroides sp.]|nr:SpaA isopeptide-forming pilin-related protein [Bacteroides sp.]MCM1550531.1 SpaA isopeptide-forming pilin-related protein [Clostridium sp.]
MIFKGKIKKKWKQCIGGFLVMLILVSFSILTLYAEEPEPMNEEPAAETVTEEVPAEAVAEATEEMPEEVEEAGFLAPLAAGDDMLHAMNIWNADGSHGSSNMTVWKNAGTSVQAPQIMYAWIGGDSYSLFCIDYGKAAHTGDSYATESEYIHKLNRNQRNAIGYVLGCAQRVQAPRNNGSFNEYGGEVTWENWRLYNSTQLMIWYYIDQYYEPGMNEGIGWDGVVQTCNSGWGDLAECERIKNIVDNLFVVPSFSAQNPVMAPSHKLTYNLSTNQYEVVLQDTNGVLGNYTFVANNLSFNRCNFDGTPNENGSYLKVASAGIIPSGTKVSCATEKAAQSGNITYVINQTSAQDLLLCSSTRPDPVRAYMNFYTESVLQISKQDITTSAELPGATLTVTSQDGSIVYDTWVSGTTPHVIHGLQTGTYVLTEVIAPDTYTKASSISFSYDAESGVTQTVVMKDSKTRIELLKTDEAGKPLAGATLEVYNAAGKLIERWTSGTEAHVMEGLAKGNYVLHEAEAPEGYVTAEDVTFSVTDKPQTIRVVMKDELIQGRIRIQKIGSQITASMEQASDYGTYRELVFGLKPLSEVVFGIYKADGSLMEKITTDKDGIAETGYLPWGEYYITELETPDGFVNTGDKVYVKLECPDGFHEAVYTEEVRVRNEFANTELHIYKLGEILNIQDGTWSIETEPLPDVVFGIYANEDITDYQGNIVIQKNECLGFAITDQEGMAAWKGKLPAGDYYYREVQTLDEYALDKGTYGFTLELGNNAVNILDVNADAPMVNELYKGKVLLIKSDSRDSSILLSGVEFELYNDDDESMGHYVTDEQGQILIEGLPYGTYYFKEVKTLDEYILDPEKQEFVLQEGAMLLELPNEKIPDTPKTGDKAPIWLLVVIGILSASVVIGLIIREKEIKKRRNALWGSTKLY